MLVSRYSSDLRLNETIIDRDDPALAFSSCIRLNVVIKLNKTNRVNLRPSSRSRRYYRVLVFPNDLSDRRFTLAFDLF